MTTRFDLSQAYREQQFIATGAWPERTVTTEFADTPQIRALGLRETQLHDLILYLPGGFDTASGDEAVAIWCQRVAERDALLLQTQQNNRAWIGQDITPLLNSDAYPTLNQHMDKEYDDETRSYINSALSLLRDEYKRKQAAEKAENEKAEAEKERIANCNRDALKNWALANGTQHLRDLISEGFVWHEIALQQYLEHNLPEEALTWEEAYTNNDEAIAWDTVTTPSEEGLRRFRELLNTNGIISAAVIKIKLRGEGWQPYITGDLEAFGHKISIVVPV